MISKNLVNKGRFTKGHRGYWLGVKRPDIAEQMRTRVVSLKTRRKMSKFHIGRPSNMLDKKLTKEQKKRLSKLWKGRPKPWLKGRKFPGRKSTNLIKGHTPWNKEKKHLAISGSKHPNWKGGVSTENEKQRKSLEYKLWRKSVFERDNFTCQKYGIRGGKLHPHHINNFSDFMELRFAIDNGITFSDKAHRKFHRRFGIKNNTKEQVEMFLNKK